MKNRLHALISKETGNCLAICSNVDDAIDLQVAYEHRNGPDTFEIVDATKQHAIELVMKDWVKQPMQLVEMVFSKEESR